MNTHILIAIFFTVISTLASAQIYKTTDEKGNPQFTDKPDPGATNATSVDLEPVNTITPIETRAAAPATVETETSATYKTLAITSPANEGIIPNGLSPTNVTAAISPALLKGHQLRLLVNGIEAGTTTSNSFVVPTLNRGTNTLQLDVLAGNDTIQSSATVTIFVYRPGG
jgi:hypothetical protein